MEVRGREYGHGHSSTEPLPPLPLPPIFFHWLSRALLEAQFRAAGTERSAYECLDLRGSVRPRDAAAIASDLFWSGGTSQWSTKACASAEYNTVTEVSKPRFTVYEKVYSPSFRPVLALWIY